MMAFLTQLVLGARNDDFEGWMQILLVVVMAVIYGLSGILKAAKSKKLEGKEGQEQQGSRTRPARTVARRVYEAPPQPQRLKAARPELVSRKTSPPKQTVPTVSQKPYVELQFSIPTSQLDARVQEVPEVMPEIERLPEFTDETVATLPPQLLAKQDQLRSTSKGLEQKLPRAAVYSGKPLLDVSDPEALRRAILHYEIFGKPLSLREQERAF